MRREEILRGVRRVLNDLQESGLEEMLERGFTSFRENRTKDSDGSLPSWVDFSVFRNLQLSLVNYGPAEQHVLDSMGLRTFYEPEEWQRFANLKSPNRVLDLRRIILNAKTFLPKMLVLLRQEHVDEAHSDPDQLPGALRGMSSLTVILPEHDEHYSSPKRLIMLLEGVDSIYGAFAKIEDVPENSLVVLALDSGSDKSLDFLGAAKVMEQTRLLINDIWDRIVFHRHRELSERVDLISKSLPVLERISELEQEGKLSPEQAGIVRLNLIGGASKFIDCGAITNDMIEAKDMQPRALMQPKQALLAAPSEASGEPRTRGTEPAGPSGVPDMHPEEELFQEFLAYKRMQSGAAEADGERGDTGADRPPWADDAEDIE